MKVRPASFHAFLLFAVSLSSPSFFQTLLSLLHRSFLSLSLSRIRIFRFIDFPSRRISLDRISYSTITNFRSSRKTGPNQSLPFERMILQLTFEKKKERKKGKKIFTNIREAMATLRCTCTRRGKNMAARFKRPLRAASHKSVSAQVISAESTARRGEDNLRYALRFERWRRGGVGGREGG